MMPRKRSRRKKLPPLRLVKRLTIKLKLRTKKKKEQKPKTPKKEPAPPKPTVHKADYQQDVVYMYQFSRTPVIPSLSPFCLKVETWLRLVGLKYENIEHRNKFRSKKGLLPFVEVNGEEIADSAIIIRTLGEKFNTDLDAGLSAEQKLISHANISMIENHLAWVTKAVFKTPEDWVKALKIDVKTLSPYPFPAPIINFIMKRKWKLVAKKVRAHGIGVHKPEEIQEFGQNDLKVLSDLLGDKDFFFGEKPSTLDVVAFANLAQLVYMDAEVKIGLRDYLLESCSNLKAFCDRVKERAFPDWEEMLANLDLNSHLPKPPPEEEKKEEKEEAKEAEATKDEEKKDEDKEKDEKESTEKEKPAEEDNKKAEESEKK